MSDPGQPGASDGETVEQMEARLLEEAAAISRRLSKISEFKRLAAELGVAVTLRDGSQVIASAPKSDGKKEAFDGNLDTLIRLYQTDPRSPYQQIRFKTRQHYDSNLRILARVLPDENIRDWDAAKVQRLYDDWTENGTTRIATSHSRISMLRMLAGFGVTSLNSDICAKLSIILNRMRFEMPKVRIETISSDHINLIRSTGHKMRRASISLAQAIQADTTLSQKDVIGEWVPENSDDGVSLVKSDGWKWMRGIRWEEINNELVLHHRVSRNDELQKFDLKNAARVLEELRRAYPAFDGTNREALPNRGPIIVSEYTRLPWTASEFRRNWRRIANTCGIPGHVKNMDSRSDNDDGKKYISPRRRKMKTDEAEKSQAASEGLTDGVQIN